MFKVRVVCLVQVIHFYLDFFLAYFTYFSYLLVRGKGAYYLYHRVHCIYYSIYYVYARFYIMYTVLVYNLQMNALH